MFPGELPTHAQAKHACESGTASPLELFIANHEPVPADYRGECHWTNSTWRTELTEALDHFLTINKPGPKLGFGY